MNILNFLCLALYYSIGKHLPASYCIGGGMSLKFRYLLCRGIFKKIEKNVNIEHGASFGKGLSIEIGDNSAIGINCKVPNNIIIGNDVMMGPECLIFENRTHKTSRTDIPMRRQGHYNKEGRTVIGDDVWIGQRTIIMPCLQISSHSIIAAGSVVTKNIMPEYTVVGGNPAQRIKSRK